MTTVQQDLFAATMAAPDTNHDTGPQIIEHDDPAQPDPEEYADTSRETYNLYAQSLRDAGELPLPYPLWVCEVEGWGA